MLIVERASSYLHNRYLAYSDVRSSLPGFLYSLFCAIVPLKHAIKIQTCKALLSCLSYQKPLQLVRDPRANLPGGYCQNLPNLKVREIPRQSSAASPFSKTANIRKMTFRCWPQWWCLWSQTSELLDFLLHGSYTPTGVALRLYIGSCHCDIKNLHLIF